MPQDMPDLDTGTAEQWFYYFRLMKYVPSMPHCFKEVLAEVISVDSARRVMTGYVATACEIALRFNVNKAFDHEFLPTLKTDFELPLTCFLHLNAHEIAGLANIDPSAFCEDLRRIGFTVTETGYIASVARPVSKLAIKGPKSP